MSPISILLLAKNFSQCIIILVSKNTFFLRLVEPDIFTSDALMEKDDSRDGPLRRSQQPTKDQNCSSHGPSVAVLPFTDLDDESRKSRTGGWVSDDVTHHLSRFRHLSVLGGRSRHTVFRKQITLKGAGRELGTRYLVIGSIRHTVEHLEAMAYLIDSASGKQLWSSSYQKPRSCLAALEDDLAADVATGIAMSIDALERARLENCGGLENVPESTPLILMADGLTKQFQRHANEQARQLIERALSIDPMSARAYAVLSRTHHLDHRYAWTSDPDRSGERAVELADLAIRLDPMEAAGYAEMGMNLHFQREHDAAFAAYRRALDINPNDPDVLADFGDFLISDGSPEQAIEPLTLAIHLRPERAGMYRYYLAGTFVSQGDDETVISLLSAFDGHSERHRVMAGSYARLGMAPEAAFHGDMAMKIQPDFSLAHWRSILPFRDPDTIELVIEGLERAGLH